MDPGGRWGPGGSTSHPPTTGPLSPQGRGWEWRKKEGLKEGRGAGGTPLMPCDSCCFCLTEPFPPICQGPGLEASTGQHSSTCSG